MNKELVVNIIGSAVVIGLLSFSAFHTHHKQVGLVTRTVPGVITKIMDKDTAEFILNDASFDIGNMGVPAGLDKCYHCIVRYSPGGVISNFIHTGLRLKKKGFLAIDGFCISACTLLADFILDKTCVTKKAVMGFHATNFDEIPPWHSPFVMKYVVDSGGWPSIRNDNLVWMTYPVTAQHWKVCNFRALLTK